MNRNQRRGRAPRRNESPHHVINVLKTKVVSDIEEVFSSKPRRDEKTVANRCCYVTPDQRDFSQYTGPGSRIIPVMVTRGTNECHTLLSEEYAFDPKIPDTISQLKELKKVLCGNIPKVENSSQYAHQNSNTPKVENSSQYAHQNSNTPKVENRSQYAHQNSKNSPIYVKTSDGSQWQNVDNIDEIDNFIPSDDKESPVICENLPKNICLPKNIFISEVPRVKIIAEKFSKYKKNNLELRRLDEKVVCVEYDIFDQTPEGEVLKSVQSMRAFFSIKPVFDEDGSEKNNSGQLPRLPSTIKHKFDINDEDLKKLTETEIEIIDGKIEENKSYLEDLRRILKRKKVINAKKNKTSLDLQSLYEMAKRDQSPLGFDYSDTNLLSKAELQDVKDLILQRCTSSVHGIRRRRVKRKENGSPMGVGVISESIVAELLREDAKLNVFH